MRRGQPPSSRTRGALLPFSRPRLTGQPPPSCSLPCPACKVPRLSLMPRELAKLPPRGTREELSMRESGSSCMGSHYYQRCYCRALLQAEVSHSVTAIHSFPASSSEERHRRPTPRRGSPKQGATGTCSARYMGIRGHRRGETGGLWESDQQSVYSTRLRTAQMRGQTI